jgi:hypothetical protein
LATMTRPGKPSGSSVGMIPQPGAAPSSRLFGGGGTHAASAFTTQPVNPETMSSRLADPDELADKMSNGQSRGNTFGVPGGLRLQLSAPPSGNSASSPFVTSPSKVWVPGEHR